MSALSPVVNEATPAADATLPHDPKAEQALVGSLLLTPSRVPSVAKLLPAEGFFDPTLRVVYSAIVERNRKGEPIDPLLLLKELRGQGPFASDNAATVLGAAAQATPTSAHAKYYAEIIREAWHKRRLIKFGGDLQESALNSKASNEILCDLRSDLDDFQRDTDHAERFKVLSSDDLASGDYSVEYLVSRTLVAGQPCVVAGPSKSMKTTVSVALAISLATGRAFLGKLSSYRTSRVLMMSGESGLATLQETAARIADSVDCELPGLTNLLWSADLPRFGDVQSLADLSSVLDSEGVDVLIVDPLYLCMSGEAAGNLFSQGDLLRPFAEICAKTETTPILVHHARKNRADSFAPLELADIAWAGIGEFARQWLLVNRREQYDPGTGEHRLWLSTGGSAGHSALWGLDIQEGSHDAAEGRTWDVAIHDPDSLRNAAKESRESKRESDNAERLEDDRRAVCRALSKGPETKSILRDRAGLNTQRNVKAVASLLNDGSILPCKISKNRTSYDGFKLAE